MIFFVLLGSYLVNVCLTLLYGSVYFLQIQELEIENEKLRSNLESLRKTVLMNQGDDSAEELLGTCDSYGARDLACTRVQNPVSV